MMIGVKERKDKGDKFSDKIRRNFERFKERVELKVKNTSPKTGILLSALLFGEWSLVSLDGMKSVLEESDPIYGQVFTELCDKIYSRCTTKQDSIDVARATLKEATGSSDPEMWVKVFSNLLSNSFRDGKCTNEDFKLLLIFYATIPYASQ
ncbi:MAG: hypothetical protein QXY61_02825 [Candidatus Anstonellales archaeon]